MSDNSSTSFIPKNPVRGSSRPRPVKRLYLISIVASILFISTVFSAVGVFIYTLSLEQNLQAEQQRLVETRDAFNQSDLEQVLEFEARLRAANEILNQQVYLPALFTALEETALVSTAYTNFEYKKDALNTLRITLETKNPTFNGVLFQREVLASNQVLQGATITDIVFADTSATNEEFRAAPNVSFTIEHTPQGRLLQRNQPITTNAPSAAVNPSATSLDETAAEIASSSIATTSDERNQ